MSLMSVQLKAEGYVDEFIEAVPVVTNPGWLFVYWPKNLTGRLSKELVKRLKMLERQMPGAGFKGWLCNSEEDHEEMHRLIEKFGAKPYAVEHGLIWFNKEIAHV